MTHPTPADQRTALIERVEAGETGRELDVALGVACGVIKPYFREPGYVVTAEYIERWDKAECLTRKEGQTRGGLGHTEDAPRLTASIDAQAALPGRIKLAQRLSYPHATTQRWEAVTDDDVQGIGPTECGARLAALLRGMG